MELTRRAWKASSSGGGGGREQERRGEGEAGGWQEVFWGGAGERERGAIKGLSVAAVVQATGSWMGKRRRWGGGAAGAAVAGRRS